jgi:hypothetical protein
MLGNGREAPITVVRRATEAGSFRLRVHPVLIQLIEKVCWVPNSFANGLV